MNIKNRDGSGNNTYADMKVPRMSLYEPEGHTRVSDCSVLYFVEINREYFRPASYLNVQITRLAKKFA